MTNKEIAEMEVRMNGSERMCGGVALLTVMAVVVLSIITFSAWNNPVVPEAIQWVLLGSSAVSVFFTADVMR